VRGLGSTLLFVVALAVGLGLWLFYFVGTTHPRHADAIVVLSGDPNRLVKGLQLLRERVAPVLAFSLAPGTDHLFTHLCARSGIECFHARPYSTEGEAKTIGLIARRREWNSLVIVSSRFHLRRAEMLFDRCTHAKLQVVPSRTPFWEYVHYAPLEAGKLFVQLTFQRSC
jgi:hypothetical protein